MPIFESTDATGVLGAYWVVDCAVWLAAVAPRGAVLKSSLPSESGFHRDFRAA